MNYANDRLKFDVARFPFASLALQEVNGSLFADGQEVLCRLSDMHAIPGVEQRLEEYRQLFFQLFRKQRFQDVYKAFGKMLIEEHFTADALIQKTPTVRVHLAGGMSVSFHSDAWYGHGEKVCSFWLPMTPVFGTNSLQMARSLSQSRKFLQRVGSERLDLDEINEQARELCDPVQADFGDLIVFNGDMLHGTVTNTTSQSRVSFDFRIAESADEIGTKPLANFYNYDQLCGQDEDADVAEPVARRARQAMMYSGLCRGVSAKSQLVFLNEYARMNDIRIVGSESEIVTFDYCPVLQKYARNPGFGVDSLLLFSVDLLPADEDVRGEIYRRAIDHGVSLVFGAEDCVLESEANIEQVERLVAGAGGRTLVSA